jgi:hypothetical protein
MPFLIVVIFIWAIPFRPGLLRARFARLLLRNELNPSYPYRGLIDLFYLGDAI